MNRYTVSVIKDCGFRGVVRHNGVVVWISPLFLVRESARSAALIKAKEARKYAAREARP